MRKTLWLCCAGFLVLPMLALAAPWEDAMQAARKKLLEADIQGTLEAAQRAHAAAPTQRLPLLLMAAIHDQRRDERNARDVYKRLKALPPAPPVPEEAQVVDPAVKAGANLFVGGARVNVRAKPDAKAELLVRLVVNVPVTVVEVQGEWARIRAYQSPGMDEATQALLAGIPTWEEGFVKASLLTSKRLVVSTAIVDAEKLEKAGDLQGALRLLSRVVVASPDDPVVWKALLRVAVETDSFGTAVDMAVRISSAGSPKLAGTETFGGPGQKTYPDPDCSRAAAKLRAIHGEPKVTQEDHGGEGFTHHTWQSQKARLVLACEGDHSNSMWVVSLADEAAAKKSTITDGGDPAFSPDGKRLLFQRGGLWVLDFNADGSKAKERRVVTPGIRGRWSPDGKRILFVGYKGGSPRGIYVIKPDGNDRRLLADIPNPYTVTWLANGTRIGWSGADGHWEAEATGANPTQVPPPCPAAPGKKIQRKNNQCVITVDRKDWQVPEEGVASPDGRWLYHRQTNEEGGNSSLRRMELAKPSNVETVLEDFGNEDQPEWDLSFSLGMVAKAEGIGESDMLLSPLPAIIIP